METLLFIAIVGYAFHFILTQQDEEYEQKSYKFFKDLFSSKKPSKTPHLDYISRKTDNLPKVDEDKDFTSKLDALTSVSINNDYKILQKQKRQYFKSEDWKYLREQVLTRDNYKCLLCSKDTTEVQLNVHHITYKNLFNERPEDLKTLCEKCHTSLHKKIGYPTKNINIYKTEYFWSDVFDQK